MSNEAAARRQRFQHTLNNTAIVTLQCSDNLEGERHSQWLTAVLYEISLDSVLRENGAVLLLLNLHFHILKKKKNWYSWKLTPWKRNAFKHGKETLQVLFLCFQQLGTTTLNTPAGNMHTHSHPWGQWQIILVSLTGASIDLLSGTSDVFN